MIPATKSAIPETINNAPETASRVVPADSSVSFEAPIKPRMSPAPPIKAAISEMISALKIFLRLLLHWEISCFSLLRMK